MDGNKSERLGGRPLSCAHMLAMLRSREPSHWDRPCTPKLTVLGSSQDCWCYEGYHDGAGLTTAATSDRAEQASLSSPRAAAVATMFSGHLIEEQPWELQAAGAAGITTSQLRFTVSFFLSVLAGLLLRCVPTTTGVWFALF